MSFGSLNAQNGRNNSSIPVYFAQGYFTLTPGQDLEHLKNELDLNANVESYRFELEHNLFTVITKDLESFNKTILLDWFGYFVSEVSCTQIGVQGVDQRGGFPFQNCND